MFRKPTWTGDVNHVMMKSSANQQKKRGTTFLTSAVLLVMLCLSRSALSDYEDGNAFNPIPQNNATNVLVDVTLTWTPGQWAGTTQGHQLWFGTSSFNVRRRMASVNIGRLDDPAWTPPSPLEPATTYYWRVDEYGPGAPTHADGNSYWGAGTQGTVTPMEYIWRFTTGTYKATNPNPSNGASNISISSGLFWAAPTVYTPTGYDVYFGTNPAAHSNPKNTIDTNSYYPPGDLTIGTTYYWAIDSNDSGTIYAGDDWSFTTSPIDPNEASNPSPSNGAGMVSLSAGLSWTGPTRYTSTSYDVYFGTGASAHSNPKYTVYTNSYDPPGNLAEGMTYYWAIDSNDSGTIYAGDDWVFSTSMPAQTWRAGARCFLDGPSGAFDDIAVKDPSIVYSGGKWHLFYTGKDGGNWRMGYASASSISGLSSATHTYMSSLNGGGYFCAPQAFWFEAKGLWYLIYQSGLGATFSTNTDINNPGGWTAGGSMFNQSGALDFWCISDGNNVYCFYSPQDGSYVIKRRVTTVADFPYNWSEPANVCSNTFEAPHVYKNIADGKYYMMVEDMSRYQELWTAHNPGGVWTQLAENWAGGSNLIYFAEHWTDQVSHGEILRAGVDEKMEISDIYQCDILIQGVPAGSYPDYGLIPYDLGLIRQCPAGPADLNLDCDVDFLDFAAFGLQWRQPPGEPSADIAPPGGDGIVDMNDLGLLVDNWLWGEWEY